MQKQQALEILNSMSIIDTDNDGEAMIYIYVENSKENREKVIHFRVNKKNSFWKKYWSKWILPLWISLPF